MWRFTTEMPIRDRILACEDPQGAAFGLLQGG
jgi:hypothetical protein